MRNVQQESGKFDEWELMQGSEFNHKQSYGYKQIFERDELLLEALAKRSVIAETRQPEIIKPSLLWNNALNIADVLTLLSVARARYYSTLAVEKNSGQHYSIGWGLMAREISGNWDFLDEVIDDWYQTRNALFHEGKQLLSVDVLKTRRQQVRDFLSLVLVEMLQKQDEIRKKEIAARMQSY